MASFYENPPDPKVKEKEEMTLPRRTYKKPKLEALGDLRSLTLGTSAGEADSGGGWIPENAHNL